MSHVRITRGRIAASVVAVSGLLGALASPAAAGVEDNKTFTVTVTGTTPVAAPDTFSGDADAAATITITNTSPTQSLGSVNVTVPAPFALVSAAADAAPGGPVIELRNLSIAPGDSRTFPVVLDVRTCAPGSGTFVATAKQSNDYNGTGNDFILVAPSDLLLGATGNCRLAFVAPPADAERNAAITSVDYSPSGTKISVEVRDAGNTGRATSATGAVTLTADSDSVPDPIAVGGSTATVTGGLATFSPGPTLAISASDYTFTAVSTSFDSSAASPEFAIVDDQVTCPAGAACQQTATAAGNTVTATFGTGDEDTSLLLSVNAADAPVFNCTGYPRGTLPVSQFDFTGDLGADRDGFMTTVITNATKPLNEYEVCWAAPYTFAAESTGTLVSDGPKPIVQVGLLTDCAKRNPVAPCVSSRSYNKQTKSVTLTVRTDGRDPWRY
jgi:hypothetical protein